MALRSPILHCSPRPLPRVVLPGIFLVLRDPVGDVLRGQRERRTDTALNRGGHPVSRFPCRRMR
eukprot:2181957-Prymnesium_polylepis.1